MNPDIAEALASVLDIIGAHCDANEGRDIWPSGLAFAGDRLGVALGLDIDARWQDVAEAFRALARPDVGLPEGWRVGKVDGHPGFAVLGPRSDHVMVRDGHIWVHEADETTYVPIEVYLYVLRAAGVAS